MYLRRKLYRMFLTLRVNNAFKARAAQLNATLSSGRIVFVDSANFINSPPRRMQRGPGPLPIDPKS
jgi:hypothetical protein